MLAFLWIIEILNLITGHSLNYLGIRPLEIDGIKGILFAPFLHGSVSHLMSNSLPFLILMWIVLTFYDDIWIRVSVFSIILGGIGVWLLGGQGTVHVGASGLIFSFIGFLLASGVFRRNIKSFIISLAVFLLYGGTLIFGVLPGQPGISWQGHLFGALAGVVLAWVYRKKQAQEQ